MGKVTLSVPDELLDRAKQYEEQIHLSPLFQQALLSAVRQVERQKLEDAEIEAALEGAPMDLVALHRRFAGERSRLYRAGVDIAVRNIDEFSYGPLRFYESISWDVEWICR